MNVLTHFPGCGSAAHFTRRTLLSAGALGLASWLTPVASLLAEPSEVRSRRRKADSLILLWLAGGPSQLETWDPHPGSPTAGEGKAIETSVRGIRFGEGLERLAEQMRHVSLIRNVVSQEGDHERAAYLVKTGYRPEAALIHPSIGAVLCHQLPDGRAELPRHMSLLPNADFGRGGFLGPTYDAFQAPQIHADLPNLSSHVPPNELQRRLKSLDVLQQGFLKQHGTAVAARESVYDANLQAATRMMTSEQLDALDITRESRATQSDFGDSSFGRACLAAMRLTEVGVRCVEVTLGGWDSHVDNFGIHRRLLGELDPAFSGLIKQLAERGRLETTLIVCCGEFGRTPQINQLGGRDHWPHGFSIALAGGRLRSGIAVGETDPKGKPLEAAQGTSVGDVHATILAALGIPHDLELLTPVGRPVKLSDGTPVRELAPRS